MKINKTIKYNLQFDNNTLCDVYLASSLYKYILEKDPSLEDYIGFSDENNPEGIHDFLYVCSNDETKIIKKIESSINEFIKEFKLVSDILEKQCEEDLIQDNLDFYKQFKKLSKVLKEKQQLDSELAGNNNRNKKLKI